MAPIDDRVYLTGVLLLSAVVVSLAFLFWLFTCVTWRWNRYITSLASNVHDQQQQQPGTFYEEQQYEPPTPAPRSTARPRVVQPRSVRK